MFLNCQNLKCVFFSNPWWMTTLRPRNWKVLEIGCHSHFQVIERAFIIPFLVYISSTILIISLRKFNIHHFINIFGRHLYPDVRQEEVGNNNNNIYIREAFIKKKKKCNIFYIRVWPPPLFCVKCNEKLIYFLSIIRAYLGHIEPIKIFYPQNHLKKYEKSAKI